MQNYYYLQMEFLTTNKHCGTTCSCTASQLTQIQKYYNTTAVKVKNSFSDQRIKCQKIKDSAICLSSLKFVHIEFTWSI